MQASRGGAAARRRARPDRAAHGRHCRARGPVQHGARPAAVCPHAGQRRRTRRRARAVAGHRGADDHAGARCRPTPAARGLGWDIDTSFSSNRGDLFPIGSFGHTGFTGTSLWIDPASKSYVIFLSSRLHPDGVGDVGVLRSRIATVAAAALSGGTVGYGSDLNPAPSREASAKPPSPKPAKPRSSPASTSSRATASRCSKARRSAWSPTTPGASMDGKSTIDLITRRRRRPVGGALQSRTRHSRHSRCRRAVVSRRQDRPADPLALRRHPPADRRHAALASTRW